MVPKCKKTYGASICEYTVGSWGSSRDSEMDYLVDLTPDHFGCSCKRDDYVCRVQRKKEGVTTNTICKHISLAMQQFYIDNVINKRKT